MLTAILIGLGVAAVGGGGWWWWKRRKEEPAVEEPTPGPWDPPEPPPVVDPLPVPPGPDPPPSPTPPPPPLTPGSKPDRLWINGEEVDSKVIDSPGDPDLGIPPGQQTIVTKLSPIVTKKGRTGTLKVKLIVEPLANPADRQALKDALHKPGGQTLLVGSHSLHLTAMPYTDAMVLMSTPKVVRKVGDVQVWPATASPSQRYLKLFFYGDSTMELEIDVPWNISNRDKPDLSGEYFEIGWLARRLPGETANEMEHGEKPVVIE